MRESSAFQSIYVPVPEDEVKAMGLPLHTKLHPNYPTGYGRSRTTGDVELMGGTWPIVSSITKPWYPNLEGENYHRRLKQIRAGEDPDKPKSKFVVKSHNPEKTAPKVTIKPKTETRKVEEVKPARKPSFKIRRPNGT